MTHPSHEPPEDLLARTFVELADILVTGFDVVSFLQLLSSRCVGLFDVASAGVMLHDAAHKLQVVASSDEQGRTLELMELQSEEGPCLDAVATSLAVSARSSDSLARWPTFTPHARSLGFQAFSAVPLRLRSQTIGALNLFGHKDVLLHEPDLRNAQALADIATISLLHERALRESRLVAEQLQSALSSRVVLEQAKGILAVTLRCPIDDAFVAMRDYARNRNLRLADVARAVVDRDPGVADIRL
ncbi:MAG: transcriptional regulator [Frankiales bacterium]|nr:transcriptional regulator [Frankiales bacterium]